MIQRYTRKEIGNIWTDETKFQTWLEIELYACEAQAELGNIPRDVVTAIRSKAKFSVDRINELEKTLNHDVIAFLTNVGESVGENSRFIHIGLTSSDIVDTALSVLIRKAALIIKKDLEQLLRALAERAREYKNTIMIGRTHGIHAEPTTFGLKLALWYEETKRNLVRLDHAIETIAYGKLSGAVGTYAHIDPFIEKYVCEKLHLKHSPISTQILQRDRHAEYLSTLAIIAGSLEKFATEIRHLQKTETLEVEEFFAEGQKGSSAMPHKRNPITCERVAGMARLMRGYALSAFENQALWHERDITHSSVERVIIPDATIALDYMLSKMNNIIETMLVYPDKMMRNLNATRGLIHSQKVLLMLTKAGMLRENAYGIVQKHAMRVWKEELDFETLISDDEAVQKVLSKDEIRECFSMKDAVAHVDLIFERLGL